jgi:hypothetical protein
MGSRVRFILKFVDALTRFWLKSDKSKQRLWINTYGRLLSLCMMGLHNWDGLCSLWGKDGGRRNSFVTEKHCGLCEGRVEVEETVEHRVQLILNVVYQRLRYIGCKSSRIMYFGDIVIKSVAKTRGNRGLGWLHGTEISLRSALPELVSKLW